MSTAITYAEMQQLLAEANQELAVRATIITNFKDERARSREMLEKAHRMVQRLRDEAQIINAQTQAVVKVVLTHLASTKPGYSEALQAGFDFSAQLSEEDFKAAQFMVLEREDHDATSGVVFKLRSMTGEEREAREAHNAKVEAKIAAIQKQLKQETPDPKT